jgi:hypothetical protein
VHRRADSPKSQSPEVVRDRPSFRGTGGERSETPEQKHSGSLQTRRERDRRSSEVRSRSWSLVAKRYVSIDLKLWGIVLREISVVECEGARTPEGRRARVHQSRPSVVDRCQRICYFEGKSLWRKVEMEEPELPKVRASEFV